MAEGDPGDLAAAYVTILPDMDEFAADLAASLEAITSSMHPTVTIEAELDLGAVEAELEAFASKSYSVHISADLSRLRSELSAADLLLKEWADQEFNVRLGANSDFVRAELVETNSELDQWAHQEFGVHLRAGSSLLRGDLVEDNALLSQWDNQEFSVRLMANQAWLRSELLEADVLLHEWADQEFSAHLGVDLGSLRNGLMLADAVLDAWAAREVDAKLGVDSSGLREALADAATQEALAPLIQKIHVVPDPAGAAAAGAIDQAVLDAMGGGGGAGPQLSFLSPAANDAIGNASRDYLQHGIDNAVTKIATATLINVKNEGIPITQDQVTELSGARTKMAAADLAKEMGLSTVLRASQGSGGGGGDVGAVLGDEGPASASWLASLSQSLKGFGTTLGRSGLPTDVADSYKPQMQEIAEALEGEVSRASAIGIGEELANMKRDLNLKTLPYLKQGAEGTAGFFGDIGEQATEDIAPGDADLTRAKTSLSSLLAQIMAAKALSADVKANLFNSAVDLNRLLSGTTTSSNLDKAVAATTTLAGDLATAKTAALIAAGPSGGAGPGLANLAAGTAAGGGGGGGGAGFFSGLGMAAGAGDDDAAKEGKGILQGMVGFGTGHIPGSGVSRWIPAMPFLAGMGSLGSLAGFGPEHVVTTIGGIAGSGVSGLLGGGLLGAGALGVAGVGMGTDLAGTGQALGDTKSTVTSMTALTTAVNQFGIGSEQAAAAASTLNQTLAGFSPIAQGAVEKAATMIETFKGSFDQATGLAEKYGAQIIQQAVKVGTAYLPVIGNFAQQNTKMIKDSLTGTGGLFDWLKSAQVGGGLDIFTQLEQTFQKGLPTAMGAATNGIEVFAKSISYLSTYTGGFMKTLDQLFTKMNTTSGMEKWDKSMANMISNFETWKNFLKELVVDVHDIFKDDAGLGASIIQDLTKMLDELNKWITSTKGDAALHSLFTVHKEQVLALLGIIPGLVTALEPLLHIMPALTSLTLPLINGFVDFLNILERVPGGIGPAVAALLGISLVIGKTAGWGNAFGFLKTIFVGIVPLLGETAAGIAGVAEASTLMQAAIGGGVLLVLAGFIYGLVQLAHATNPVIAALAGVTLAAVAFYAVWDAGKLSTITGFFTKLGGLFTGAGEAVSTETAVVTGAMAEQTEAVTGAMAEQTAAITTALAAQAAAVAGEDAGIASVSAAWSAAGVSALDMVPDVTAATVAVETEATAQVLAIERIAAAWVEAGTAGATAASVEDAAAGAGGAGALGVGFAGVGVAAGVALAPVAAIAAGVWGVNAAINALYGAPDPFGKIKAEANGATGLQGVQNDIKSIQDQIIKGFNSSANTVALPSFPGLDPQSPKFNQQLQSILSNQTKLKQFTTDMVNSSQPGTSGLDKGLGTLINYNSNLSWLEKHFGITASQAADLAQEVGINLGNAMDTSGTKVKQIATLIGQMAAQSGIAKSALFYLAQQSGETAQQISNSMSQAASATQQLMDTFTNIPAGATAFQQNAAQQAQTALSNAQQSQQLQQAITQAQQQLATDTTSGQLSITSAAQSAAQPGATPGGVAQAQQSAQSQIQQDQQAISQAQTALSNFNATVAQSAQATQQALSIPPDMILQSMQANLKQASTFNQDIQDLMKAGFNPSVVNQIVTAGVTGGLSTAQGLLQGYVANGGAAYVSQVNSAAAALQQVSVVAIEQAKLMAVATLPKTKTSTALEEPQAVGLFENMYSVNPTKALTGSGKVDQSWLNGQDLTLKQAQKLAQAYGLTITGVVNDTADSVNNSIGGTLKKAGDAANTQLDNYLKALAKVKTTAGAAAMGAAGYVPKSAEPGANAVPGSTAGPGSTAVPSAAQIPASAKSSITDVGNALTDILKVVKSTIEPDLNAIDTTFGKLGPQVNQSIQNVTNTFGAISKLFNAIGLTTGASGHTRAMDDIVVGLDAILFWGRRYIEPTIKNIENDFALLGPKVDNALKSITGLFGSISKLFNAVGVTTRASGNAQGLQAVATALYGIATEAKPIDGAIKEIESQYKKVDGGTGHALSAIEGFFGSVSKLFNAVGTTIRSSSNATGVTSITNALHGLVAAGMPIEYNLAAVEYDYFSLSELAGKGEKSVAGFFGTISKLFNAVGTTTRASGNAMGVNYIVTALEGLANASKSIDKSLGTIKSNYGKAMQDSGGTEETVSKFMSQVSTMFQTTGAATKSSGAGKVGADIVSGVAQGVKGDQGALNSALLGVVKSSITSAGGQAGGQSVGVDIVKGITGGLHSSGTSLNSTLLDVVKAAITTDDPKVGGQSLGAALVKGIEAGITTAQTSLNNAVIAAVKTAISADVGQVGGQSLGTALVNGIVQGINQSAPKITQAMTSAVSGGISASQSVAANAPMPTASNAHAGGGATIAPTYNMSVINAQGMNQAQLASAIQQGVQQANAELLQLVNAHGG